MDKNQLSGPDKNEAVKKSPRKKQNTLIRLIGEVDRPFLILVIVLVCIGSIMVFSASYAAGQNRYNDSYFFARRQLMWVFIGLLAMMFIAKLIRHSVIKKFAYVGLLGSLGLNAAVIALGFVRGGAQRWIEIAGIQLQPSELLKFFVIVACAKYISENQNRMNKFTTGILPFIILMVPCAAFLLLQSHLSATIIVLLLIFMMMFLGGANIVILGSAGITGVLAMLGLSMNVDALLKIDFIQNKLGHVYSRLLVWRDPFSYMGRNENPLLDGKGWQPAQSLYAISSGGFWGIGLGRSMQKHGYLPEPQNDYIFAILCEELGFSGAVVVICLFLALIIRGFHIAKNCNDKFCSLVVMGLMLKIAIQVLLNIAVVTNTIPSTGISLPFFSYGGTALMIQLAEIGIVLSISRYSYIEKG